MKEWNVTLCFLPKFPVFLWICFEIQLCFHFNFPQLETLVFTRTNQFFLIIHSIVLSSIDRFPSDQKWGEKEKGNIGGIDSWIKETKNLKTQMENVLWNTIRITGIVKLIYKPTIKGENKKNLCDKRWIQTKRTFSTESTSK